MIHPVQTDFTSELKSDFSIASRYFPWNKITLRGEELEVENNYSYVREAGKFKTT